MCQDSGREGLTATDVTDDLLNKRSASLNFLFLLSVLLLEFLQELQKQNVNYFSQEIVENSHFCYVCAVFELLTSQKNWINNTSFQGVIQHFDMNTLNQSLANGHSISFYFPDSFPISPRYFPTFHVLSSVDT